jgi:hypothetical protein
MRSRHVPAFVLCALLGVAADAAAQQIAHANVTIIAGFAPRTSLKVSSELLQFDVAQTGGTATAAIDFSASARTPSQGEIVLIVEPLRGLSGPGGAADVDAAISVAGEGEGLIPARLDSTRATVVGRWNGSGRRQGRLVFTLNAMAAGIYSMPVRFVLSTP